MKIILTGSTSFIGRAATDKLRALGHEVTALRHSFEEATEQGITLPERADVWLHFAWAGVGSAGRSDPAIQAYNVSMSMSALKKAAELGCRRFLFSGSQAEYGGRGMRQNDGHLLQTEDGPAEPVSEYGKAKLQFRNEAEFWIQECTGASGKHDSAVDSACEAASETNMDQTIGTRAAVTKSVPLRYVHMRIFSAYGPGDHRGSLQWTDAIVGRYRSG